MKIKILKVSGSTFIYWLITFAILCLIIAIVIQINDRVDPKLRSACIENLKQIERDKISFIINTHTTNNALVMEGIYETKPFCPVGGVYTLGGVNVTPTCSIPGHYIWKPEPRSLGTLKIDNCSYINIGGKPLNDETIRYTFAQIKRFETNSPELHITGRQVITSASDGIMGVFIWHEPKTNAPAPR